MGQIDIMGRNLTPEWESYWEYNIGMGVADGAANTAANFYCLCLEQRFTRAKLTVLQEEFWKNAYLK